MCFVHLHFIFFSSVKCRSCWYFSQWLQSIFISSSRHTYKLLNCRIHIPSLTSPVKLSQYDILYTMETMRWTWSLPVFSVKSDLDRFTEYYDGNNMCNTLQSSFPDARLKSPLFKRGKVLCLVLQPVVMSFWSMALVWIVFPVTHVWTMRYLFFPLQWVLKSNDLPTRRTTPKLVNFLPTMTLSLCLSGGKGNANRSCQVGSCACVWIPV